jgi:hypothetical protein
LIPSDEHLQDRRLWIERCWTSSLKFQCILIGYFSQFHRISQRISSRVFKPPEILSSLPQMVGWTSKWRGVSRENRSFPSNSREYSHSSSSTPLTRICRIRDRSLFHRGLKSMRRSNGQRTRIHWEPTQGFSVSRQPRGVGGYLFSSVKWLWLSSLALLWHRRRPHIKWNRDETFTFSDLWGTIGQLGGSYSDRLIRSAIAIRMFSDCQAWILWIEVEISIEWRFKIEDFQTFDYSDRSDRATDTMIGCGRGPPTLSEEPHFWEYLCFGQELAELFKGWMLFQFNVGSSWSQERIHKTARSSNRTLQEYLPCRRIDQDISLRNLIRFVILSSSPVWDSDLFSSDGERLSFPTRGVFGHERPELCRTWILYRESFAEAGSQCLQSSLCFLSRYDFEILLLLKKFSMGLVEPR